jgi:carbonic anhydrase
LPADEQSLPVDRPTTPAAALAELLEGNSRFVTGTQRHPHQDAVHRGTLADAQTPYAVIFGCSDSRLAAEIIFDQGLGDLFVVRTAGHTVGTEALGSIEFAVTALGTPLVVVLGHSGCGAVRAAAEAVKSGDIPPGHLGALVDAVVPSVRLAGRRRISAVDGIVDVHIERTVDDLLRASPVLAEAVATGRCAVVGMSYHLTAGRATVLAAAGEADQPAGQTPRSR